MTIYTHPNCGQPCADPLLKVRSGQQVEILGEVDAAFYDKSEVGLMLEIKFSDGYRVQAFADELSARPMTADEQEISDDLAGIFT